MTCRMLAVVGLLAAAVPASADDRIIDLRTLGWERSGAHDINEAGQIVGWNGPMKPWATLWQDGVQTWLGMLDGPSAESLHPQASHRCGFWRME